MAARGEQLASARAHGWGLCGRVCYPRIATAQRSLGTKSIGSFTPVPPRKNARLETMASYSVLGRADSVEFAKAEYLTDLLKARLPAVTCHDTSAGLKRWRDHSRVDSSNRPEARPWLARWHGGPVLGQRRGCASGGCSDSLAPLPPGPRQQRHAASAAASSAVRTCVSASGVLCVA